MGHLQGVETALVTGASSGIGEALACQLAARGCDLVLVARSDDRLQALAGKLAAECGARVHVVAADLSQPGAAEQVVAETERLGLEIDLLVNNAGFGRYGRFAELPFDVQAGMLRLNANAVMELTHLYLPGMRRRGRGGVINVASNAAFQPVPTMAVYAASKAFVLHFSQALTEELAGEGVHVLALCPGATDTDLWEEMGIAQNLRRFMPPPAKIAAAGLRAFDRGRATTVPGLIYNLVAFGATHLAPRRLVTRIAYWLLGRFLA